MLKSNFPATYNLLLATTIAFGVEESFIGARSISPIALHGSDSHNRQLTSTASPPGPDNVVVLVIVPGPPVPEPAILLIDFVPIRLYPVVKL